MRNKRISVCICFIFRSPGNDPDAGQLRLFFLRQCPRGRRGGLLFGIRHRKRPARPVDARGDGHRQADIEKCGLVGIRIAVEIALERPEIQRDAVIEHIERIPPHFLPGFAAYRGVKWDRYEVVHGGETVTMAKAIATKKKDWTITQNNVTDKEKALQTALQGIEKQFGALAVMRLGERKNMNIQSISTGLFTLDLALGVGGLPKGRITEIYGPESSGKTTIALLAVAEAQKAGGICVFIDAEHALDPEYAKKLGVDTENLYVSQPDNGEQALEIAEELARSGAIALIVIDSVAALVPRAEIEGEMGASHVGLQARLMSQGLRKLAGIVGKTKTVLIFINQLREKLALSMALLKPLPAAMR